MRKRPKKLAEDTVFIGVGMQLLVLRVSSGVKGVIFLRPQHVFYVVQNYMFTCFACDTIEKTVVLS